MKYPKNSADILITKDCDGFYAVVKLATGFVSDESGYWRPSSWAAVACVGPCGSNYGAEADGKRAAMIALCIDDAEFSPYGGNTIHVPYTTNIGVWTR